MFDFNTFCSQIYFFSIQSQVAYLFIMLSITFSNLTKSAEVSFSPFTASALFLCDSGAFLSIFKPCYSTHEITLLSFMLAIVTVPETISHAVETSSEE